MDNFNPDEYLAKADAGGFDPDAYLAKNGDNNASAEQINAIEPNAFGDTVPVEQKLLNNATTALSGATLPSSIVGLGKGVAGTLGKYAERFGQNQAIRALGASGGQIGQVGIPESRQIAQMMLDKGVISPLRGPIGLEEKVGQLHQAAGEGIGAARKLADTRGQAPQMAELLDSVNKNLTGKYASGVEKAPAMLNRAKETIAQGGTGTFIGNAKKATELNDLASANKIYRPQGAVSDTADLVAHQNDAALRPLLTPAEDLKYTKDLGEYGPLSTVKKFLERGERREMAGRGSATIGKAVHDATMDMMGNRVAATAGNKLGKVLKMGNDVPTNPTSLAAYLLKKEEENR